jgi:3-dehydroquinate synthase
MQSINVALGARSYDIVFSSEFPGVGKRRTLLVTDSNINALYRDKLVSILDPVDVFVIPAGEESKNAGVWLDICRTAARHHLGRDCRFVACGGGVTGDMTGFAASAYLRGVRFIQIPTSLLAMVDSSVGGKTGIDIPEGKNLIGAFHQPELVWINTDFLSTLPAREFGNGLAEIVKTAVIRDEEFFSLLEENASKLRDAGNKELFNTIIRRCCEIKSEVVSCDEKESGLRAILNYGHTFAHPIETLSSYSICHGEAVSIGMEYAGELAAELGLWSVQDQLRQSALLDRLALPRKRPENIGADEIIELMKSDKKNRDGRITFVLPEKIGKVCVTGQVPVETVRNMLGKALK